MRQLLDTTTSQALRHTLHCLQGCAIGEVLGITIGAQLAWPNALQTLLAVILAFAFGYGLTYRGARSMGMSHRHAQKLAFRTDTISIMSMELIDNVIEYLIPGAMNAHVSTWLFWWSLTASLATAFILTVPVNRLVLARNGHQHHHHIG